jgi:hypothetical protein
MGFWLEYPVVKCAWNSGARTIADPNSGAKTDVGVRGETLLSVVRLCGELTSDGGEAVTLGVG